nr:immunoglobulin heavy chain junction region [Macaca mulatta]MOV91208.1 immunoglobulin heavy chain junction region [Macaca mulatta]MOV91626.1 immunoglobulin heavy chain junction region [Macaca mulatta]
CARGPVLQHLDWEPWYFDLW